MKPASRLSFPHSMTLCSSSTRTALTSGSGPATTPCWPRPGASCSAEQFASSSATMVGGSVGPLGKLGCLCPASNLAALVFGACCASHSLTMGRLTPQLDHHPFRRSPFHGHRLFDLEDVALGLAQQAHGPSAQAGTEGVPLPGSQVVGRGGEPHVVVPERHGPCTRGRAGQPQTGRGFRDSRLTAQHADDRLGGDRAAHAGDGPDAALAELRGIGPRTVVWLNEAQFYLDAAEAGPVPAPLVAATVKL